MKLDEIKTCVRCGGAYKPTGHEPEVLPDMFSRHPVQSEWRKEGKSIRLRSKC